MKKIFCLLSLLLMSCSSSDPKPGYTEVWSDTDVYYTCNDGECGGYPELMRCEDSGTIPAEIRCVFVKDVGCNWVIIHCYADEP